MKRFLLRLGKVTTVLLLILVTAIFIWANWEEPGPGGKAPVVNFLQYDASIIGDSARTAKIAKTIREIDGVRGTTYNAESNLLIVCYGVDAVDLETIQHKIAEKYHIKLKEKKFTKSGPKCPIDVAYISRVKHFFCVRD